MALLKRAGIAAGIDGCRGLDHGAWVPLRYMYPDADVPVVQLAVQPDRGTAHHVELGRALAPLADEGVLIVGSGHTTHNLRDWMRSATSTASRRPYAQAFADVAARNARAGDTDALVRYRDRAPDAERAHPTEEHFLPLFVAWGAAGAGARVERVVEGIEGGVLSMDSYRFDPTQHEAGARGRHVRAHLRRHCNRQHRARSCAAAVGQVPQLNPHAADHGCRPRPYSGTVPDDGGWRWNGGDLGSRNGEASRPAYSSAC